MANRKYIGMAIASALLIAGAASAHHSFAAFFDPDKQITIKGTVTAFAFKNPHGTISLNASADGGPAKEWRVETNAPVVLMRRGWTRTSIKPGDIVIIRGWVSRDGKAYLRLREARRADGSPIGKPFGEGED